MRTKEILTLITGLAVGVATAQAQYTPVPLTPESFTFDIVVEKEAAKSPARAATASFDGGTNNTGNTFYEIGFNQAAADTGLPAAGSLVSNPTLTRPHNYQMPASYTANNSLFVDATVPSATLTLNTPAPYNALSLLATSGGGAGVVNYTVTYADDSTEIGVTPLTVPDWFGGADPTITTRGRVNTQTRVFADVNSTNPRVYSIDIPLAETTKAVKSITITRVSGGRVGVFALSGATSAEGAFDPIAVSGFNYDVVIEATADPARTTPLGATTGTMDGGANNNANTWYERGWLMTDLGTGIDRSQTGIPVAGSTFTSQTFPDHQYQMPASYTENNAVIITSLLPNATLTPVTPIAATGLSILGASGNGAIGLNYTINHQDGSTQTGTVAIPDWFNGAPIAVTASGRVDVGNGLPNNVGAANPRLYGIDIFVVNSTSPITSIAFTHATGTGRTALMGLSATAGPVRPTFVTEPAGFTGVNPGGSAQLSGAATGTAPFTYQWQKLVSGNWENVTDNARVTGATTSTLSFQNITSAEGGDYRLVISNASGSANSRTARIGIVSTKTDVTIPSDIVAIVGGSSPASGNESVDKSINDNTSKYLNYGLPAGNTAAPFEGPVGLQLELGERAVITGLRMYTANDGPERDPVAWELLASNDPAAAPETFQVIASGNFNLPLERNAGNLAIDPLVRANEEVSFQNGTGYQFYRLMILNTRNSTTANSMQFGEVEFLGTFGAGAPELTIARNEDGTITITSSMPGTLQSTENLSTTPIDWDDVGPIDGSVTLPTTGTMRFFRVVRPQ